MTMNVRKSTILNVALLICLSSQSYAQEPIAADNFSGISQETSKVETGFPVTAENQGAEPKADDIKMVFAPRDINDPLESVLGTQLKDLLLAVERGAADPAKSASLPQEYVSNAQSVAVNIFLNPEIPGTPIVDWLAAHDLKPNWVYTPDWVAVRMPITLLRELAKEQNVARVKLSDLVHFNAAHEGVRASRAERWQNLGDIKGRGVRIAIIDSFDRITLASQQAAGEIPPTDRLDASRIRTGGVDSSNHGNQTLEVLYDMAPDAQFTLYDSSGSIEELAMTVNNVTDADIISMSLGAVQGYNDGRANAASPIIQAIKAAHAAGMLVVTSAGNSGNKHWSGTFRPSPANANHLNWNYNTFTNSLIDPPLIDNGINILKTSENSTCIPNGESILIELVVEEIVRTLSGWEQSYVLRLVRQGSDGMWRTMDEDRTPLNSLPVASRTIRKIASDVALVYGTSDESIRRPGESDPFYLPGSSPIGAYESSPGCDAHEARYGIKILRNVAAGAASTNQEPYLQIFSNYDQLSLSVAESSIEGIAASPWSLSVGAAYCDSESAFNRPAGGACSNLNVANFSARGPVVRSGGGRPIVFRPEVMPEINPALRLQRLPEVKPEVLGLTNLSVWLSTHSHYFGSTTYKAFSGTSAATPYVAGIAALMLERFGDDLKQKPDELKYALLQLASMREADVVSRGYPSTVSYDKGFGLLRLQREDRLEYRGCTASARINVPLMANQLDASDRSCDEPFTDGYDKTVRARFLDSSGQVVMYPLGYPMISIRNGPAGTMPTDLKGSTRQDVLFSFPYSDPGRGVPRIGSRDGWFAFPNLKFVRIPTDSAGRTIEVTNPYSLKMQAQTINGAPIPIAGSAATAGEAIRESYPPRDTIVCNVGVTDSRCPSM